MSIRSAINSSTSMLDADFEWTEAQSADIHIVDISQVQDSSNYPVVIRYTRRRNGRPVDLYRPIHVGILHGALERAIQAHKALGSSAAKSNPPPRRYRGAIVDAPLPAPPQTSSKTPRRGLTYRGARVE